MLRWKSAISTTTGLMLLCAVSAAAEVELPLPEEESAKAAIQSLRNASRSLKRLSREAREDEPDYATWLASSGKKVQRLGARWASALDYFGRDFPHDALRADPERLAYAKEWLGERNAELDGQADELAQLLLEANAGFEGRAAAARLARAREALEAIR